MSGEDASGASRRPALLLGLTGSVATIKAAELVTKLAPHFRVKVILTAAAKHFARAEDIPLPPEDVHADEDEWRSWRGKGDPVLHIELRRWADVLLVAPCSANTLAKFANGMCDNLLTCVFRAWDFTAETKRVLIAPAMNTAMFESPFTRKHADAIAEAGGAVRVDTRWEGGSLRIVPTVVKTLACGDVGDGAMAEVDDIVREACEAAAEGRARAR